MAERRPLVHNSDGTLRELPAGDSLPGVRGVSITFLGLQTEASQFIGGSFITRDMTLVVSNSGAISLKTFAAAKVFLIMRNGSQIGTISFAAGATVGVVAYSSAAVTSGDRVYVVGPSSADTTGGDIMIRLWGAPE